MVLVDPSTTLSSFNLLIKRKESQLQLWYVHMQAFQSTERKSWRDHEKFSLTGTTKHHSGMTVPNLTSSESWVLPSKRCMGSPSKCHFLKDPGKWRHSSSTASLSIWKTHQKNDYISALRSGINSGLRGTTHWAQKMGIPETWSGRDLWSSKAHITNTKMTQSLVLLTVWFLSFCIFLLTDNNLLNAWESLCPSAPGTASTLANEQVNTREPSLNIQRKSVLSQLLASVKREQGPEKKVPAVLRWRASLAEAQMVVASVLQGSFCLQSQPIQTSHLKVPLGRTCHEIRFVP